MAASAAGTSGLDRVLVGEVRLHEVNALAERRGEFVEGRPAGAGERHRRALRMERAGDGAADAARGAGHEGLAAGQIEHAGLLISREGRL
jgi:hypothetical protein